MKKAVSDIMLNKVVERIRAMIATKASGDHNHDGTYSAEGHTHTAEAVGAASAAHSHDGTYAPANHEHDDKYSAKDHNHDGVYATASHTHKAAEAGLLCGETLPDAGAEGRIFIQKTKSTVIEENTFQTTTTPYTLYLVVEGKTISNNSLSLDYRLGMSRPTGSIRFNQYTTGWEVKLNDTQVSYCAKDNAPQTGFEENVYDITITQGTAIVPYTQGLPHMPIFASIDMKDDERSPGPMTIEGSIDMSNICHGGIYIDNGTEWELYVS